MSHPAGGLFSGFSGPARSDFPGDLLPQISPISPRVRQVANGSETLFLLLRVVQSKSEDGEMAWIFCYSRATDGFLMNVMIFALYEQLYRLHKQQYYIPLSLIGNT